MICPATTRRWPSAACVPLPRAQLPSPRADVRPLTDEHAVEPSGRRHMRRLSLLARFRLGGNGLLLVCPLISSSCAVSFARGSSSSPPYPVYHRALYRQRRAAAGCSQQLTNPSALPSLQSRSAMRPSSPTRASMNGDSPPSSPLSPVRRRWPATLRSRQTNRASLACELIIGCCRQGTRSALFRSAL